MPKSSYDSFNEEKYHSAFARVLREELLTKSEDVKKLADFLQISQQAVNQFKQGQSFPKIENLIKIAQYFNCSLDYLIGLSDVRSPNADVQAVCNYTGLSEPAVWKLHKEVESIQYILSRGSDIHLTDEIILRCMSRMIVEDLGVFRDLGRYLYYSYSGFAEPGSDPENEAKAVSIKCPLGGRNAEYTYLDIKDVQDLMLMKIEKRLREIRESSLKGIKTVPGTVESVTTEDGSTELKFVPYYQEPAGNN